MQHFWHGLTRPSLTAIIIACGVSTGTFILLAFAITAEFMSHSGDVIFAATNRDYDVFSSTRALRLKSERPQIPKLILLGGSTMRATFLEGDLRDTLANAGLGGVEVVKLCTSRQLLWDSLAFIDTLPVGARGVLMLGVSPGQFTTSRDELLQRIRKPRLAFQSQVQNETAAILTIAPKRRETGIYALDNIRFLLGRVRAIASNVTTDSAPQMVDSWYIGRYPLPRDQYMDQSVKVQNRFELYEVNRKANFTILDALVKAVQLRTKLKLVLVEMPINPSFIEVYSLQGLISQHEQRMHEFSREHDIRYVVMEKLLALKPTAFYDWAHLNDPETVRRASQSVVSKIADLFKEYQQHKRSM
ncbi:MAG: hypothetical protein ABGX16_16130 [Pirellulales bacterium]